MILILSSFTVMQYRNTSTKHLRFLKPLLNKHCGLKEMNSEDWKWMLLFGVPFKSTVVNLVLVNIILAMSRMATWQRRNCALYEDKHKGIHNLFTNSVKLIFIWRLHLDVFN